MAKKTELLNSYSNSDAAATLQKIEAAPAAQGGFYTVFYGQEGPRQQSKDPEITAKLKAEVQRIFPEAHILAEVAPDGKRAIIVHTAQDLKQTTAQAEQATGQKFTQDQRVVPFTERYELTKWRGHLGNIGQFFILLSGLGLNKWVSEKIFKQEVKGKDKFSSPDKVVSTVASVMGNGLNSWFGVQKKPDNRRLEVVKSKVNDFILTKGAKINDLPESTARLTHYDWRERPHEPGQKAQVFFEQNAGIMSEVLKIVGKYSYFVGGKEKENEGDKLHGAISMAAKFVTVLGKDEDPYGMEGKQDWFNRLRQRSNLISGGMEWLANISQFVGAVAAKVPGTLRPDHILNWSDEAQAVFNAEVGEDKKYVIKPDLDKDGNEVKNKKGDILYHYAHAAANEKLKIKEGDKVTGFALLGKDPANLKTKPVGDPSPSWQMADWKNSYLMNWKKWDWLQLIGATFFTLSLTTKMMAPFTEKKVNLTELNAHSAVGLAASDAMVRSQQTAEVAAHLLELRAPTGLKMLPEVHKQGLAATFAGIADTLYTRYEQDVTANGFITGKVVKATADTPEHLIPVEPPIPIKITKVDSPKPEGMESAHNTAIDMRDKLKEARDRGEGAFLEKFGQTNGMAPAAV